MKKRSDDVDSVKKILNDKTSGSTDLLLKLNSLALKNIGNKKKIRSIISEAGKFPPDFQAIKNYISKVEKLLIENDPEGLLDYLNHIAKAPESIEYIYNRSKKYLKDINCILTLSNSRSVSDFIKVWHNDKSSLNVIIAESRPKLEGRRLAQDLLKGKIRIQFITDAEMGVFIPKCDAVLTGADKILVNGNVINKTGSLAAAVLCKEFRKPFLVVAQKEKFSKDDAYKPTDQSPAEVWNKKDTHLRVRNFYFEEIDKKFISRIFS